MEMKYYVIVLPKAEADGKVNRQIYECEDLDSAKVVFHGNCSKYFKNDAYSFASVCITDIYGNNLNIKDYWEKPTPEPSPEDEISIS